MSNDRYTELRMKGSPPKMDKGDIIAIGNLRYRFVEVIGETYDFKAQCISETVLLLEKLQLPVISHLEKCWQLEAMAKDE